MDILDIHRIANKEVEGMARRTGMDSKVIRTMEKDSVRSAYDIALSYEGLDEIPNGWSAWLSAWRGRKVRWA